MLTCTSTVRSLFAHRGASVPPQVTSTGQTHSVAHTSHLTGFKFASALSTLSYVRSYAARPKPSSKRPSGSKSQAFKKKVWREVPNQSDKSGSNLKVPKQSKLSPTQTISKSKSSKNTSKVSSSGKKPDNLSKSRENSNSSQPQPVQRPHILRDARRIEAAKHKIRKVTGDVTKESKVDNGEEARVERHPRAIYNPSFTALQIMGPLLHAIHDLGWTTATPVQEGTIALGIRGLNVVASAETGTGKTGSYAIPMLQRIYVRKKYEENRGIIRDAAPLGVVLCPTRELAEQVEDQIFELAKYIDGMRIVGVSGSLKDVDIQIKELKKGVDILVATPGRLLRLLNEKTTPEDELEGGDLPEFEGELYEEEEFEDLAPVSKSLKKIKEKSTSSSKSAKQDEELYEYDDAELFDDGVGEMAFDDDLEEVVDAGRSKRGSSNFGSDEMGDSEAWDKLLAPARDRSTKKKKHAQEDQEGIYSKWDRAIEDLDRTDKNARKKFQERLPSLPHGQAVKNANIDLTHVRHFALDEVDRMLAMGMFPEVRHLFKAMPRPQGRKDPERMQVFMFTATLVPRVSELIKRFAPHHVRVDLNKAMNVAGRVKQFFYQVGPRRKHALLTYLLRRRGSMKGQQVLVFCRTRQRVDRLAEQLTEEGFTCAGIHGELSLSSRQTILDEFKSGGTQVLVATEIMARGMDIPNLPFVVNYDLPHSPEEYVHRIGRTARAGQSGTAFSFVSSEPSVIEVGKRLVELDEMAYLGAISQFLKRPYTVSKVPGPWKDEDKISTSSSSSSSSSSPSSSSSTKRSNKDKQKPLPNSTTSPVFDVKSQKIVDGDELRRRREKKYTYMEDDAELRSAIPPERNIVDKVEVVLSRLHERKSRQVMHASQSSSRRKMSEVDDAQAALKDRVSLRDFKEGRYEDVMEEFATRRARKLGVHVPKNLDRTLAEKRKSINKVAQQKLKQRQRRQEAKL